MDYLKDCMNDVGNPPIDAMHRNFCLVCANRGCERSGMSQSAFDSRVKNWRYLEQRQMTQPTRTSGPRLSSH